MQEGGSGSLNTQQQPLNGSAMGPAQNGSLVHQPYGRVELDSFVPEQQNPGATFNPAPHTAPRDIHLAARSAPHAGAQDASLMYPAFMGRDLASSTSPLHQHGPFICDVVPEEEEKEADAEEDDWSDGPNFTPWHLRKILRLLRNATMHNNTWLSSIISHECYVEDAGLAVWAENTLQGFVNQCTQTQEQFQGYAVAWLVSISQCSVFKGPGLDLVGFSEWLHKLLAHFPNLACLLGTAFTLQMSFLMHQPAHSLCTRLGAGFSLPEQTLLAVKQQCWDVQSSSLDLLPCNGPRHLQTREGKNQGGGRSARRSLGAQPLATQAKAPTTRWKHHMCDWKDLWDHLASQRQPLLDHAREVWDEFQEREQAQADQAHAHTMYSLPHSDDIPGAKESVSGDPGSQLWDQAYSEQCQEVAWMLRHLYEEQCEFYSSSAPQDAPSNPSQPHDACGHKCNVPMSGLPQCRSLDTPPTPVSGVVFHLCAAPNPCSTRYDCDKETFLLRGDTL